MYQDRLVDVAVCFSDVPPHHTWLLGLVANVSLGSYVGEPFVGNHALGVSANRTAAFYEFVCENQLVVMNTYHNDDGFRTCRDWSSDEYAFLIDIILGNARAPKISEFHHKTKCFDWCYTKSNHRPVLCKVGWTASSNLQDDCKPPGPCTLPGRR